MEFLSAETGKLVKPHCGMVHHSFGEAVRDGRLLYESAPDLWLKHRAAVACL